MTAEDLIRVAYGIVVTDAKGFNHFPVEGAHGMGKTTIERSDSSALYHGYQLFYTKRSAAENQLDRIRVLAEAKGRDATLQDRPMLPIEVSIYATGEEE